MPTEPAPSALNFLPYVLPVVMTAIGAVSIGMACWLSGKDIDWMERLDMGDDDGHAGDGHAGGMEDEIDGIPGAQK
jgi:hypothetical protein